MTKVHNKVYRRRPKRQNVEPIVTIGTKYALELPVVALAKIWIAKCRHFTSPNSPNPEPKWDCANNWQKRKKNGNVASNKLHCDVKLDEMNRQKYWRFVSQTHSNALLKLITSSSWANANSCITFMIRAVYDWQTMTCHEITRESLIINVQRLRHETVVEGDLLPKSEVYDFGRDEKRHKSSEGEAPQINDKEILVHAICFYKRTFKTDHLKHLREQKVWWEICSDFVVKPSALNLISFAS